MPKKIEAQSEDAQLRVESKRLRRLLKQLRDEFDDMPAAKKWALVKRVMIILVRIELQRSKRD